MKESLCTIEQLIDQIWDDHLFEDDSVVRWREGQAIADFKYGLIYSSERDKNILKAVRKTEQLIRDRLAEALTSPSIYLRYYVKLLRDGLPADEEEFNLEP